MTSLACRPRPSGEARRVCGRKTPTDGVGFGVTRPSAVMHLNRGHGLGAMWRGEVLEGATQLAAGVAQLAW